MGKLPFECFEKKILVKKQIPVNGESAPLPMEDFLNYCIINVDKPRGPTSHQIVDFIKRILGASKAGHSGTLDPHVTGVLPMAVGRATRLTQALLSAGKEYVAVMYLHKEVPEERLRKGFSEFTGQITQLPPVKSAVKRVERERTIYYVDILEIDGQFVLFRIGCQAGTYIRKYIHDLGNMLGVGAHMAELRRTRVASFNESSLCTLQELTDALWYYRNEKNEKPLRKILQPAERAVDHLRKVWVMDSTLEPLSHGRDLAIPGIIQLESGIVKGEMIVIFDPNSKLVSLGIAQMDSGEMMQNEKGIAVKNDKVFIREMGAQESQGL